MDLAKLGNKARNELRRNPKKSAVLVIVALVALYFWLPLLRNWLPGGAAKQTAKAKSKKPVAAAAVTPGDLQIALSAVAPAAIQWDELVRQRKQDPLTSSAALPTDRDPFRLSDALRPVLAEPDEDETARNAPPEKPLLEQTPQRLGLVLEGTLVGPRVHAATINRRTYALHSEIAVGSSSPEAEKSEQPKAERIKFTLAEVRKDEVVLTRGDQSYTLSFRRTELPEGDGIVLRQSPVDDK